MKVIIADDSQVMRRIIENAIQSMGLETLHAGNGHEVITLLEKHGSDIAVIFMDWNMPGMNGLECLKSLKGNDLFKHIPVLIISTESEEERIDTAMAAGAKGYLTKPFTSEELIKFINTSI